MGGRPRSMPTSSGARKTNRMARLASIFETGRRREGAPWSIDDFDENGMRRGVKGCADEGVTDQIRPRARQSPTSTSPARLTLRGPDVGLVADANPNLPVLREMFL